MNYTVIRLVVFALYDQDDALHMLRRRRIYPTDDVLAEVDVDLWRRCVNYLTLCLFLPWFIPRCLFHALSFLPTELCIVISKLGFLSHLDILDRDYYANSGHGTASIDFIIKTVDYTFLPMGPPPLRRSCTGWYTNESKSLKMTDAEHRWLKQHSAICARSPKTRCAYNFFT